jgi:hypothetical protein
MPRFLRAIADRLERIPQPINRYEGFKGDGALGRELIKWGGESGRIPI